MGDHDSYSDFLANAGYFFAPAFAGLWKTGSEVS
jgi:hypothetical protein